MRGIRTLVVAAAVTVGTLPTATLQETAMKKGSTGKYADVNGLKMYYEVHGSGQPLVLLHGGFGMAEAWAPVLPTLVPNRQVIILEQQGHGRTADRSEPLTYERMAEDTATLLKHLKVREADIFGYSDGGIVGLGVTIRYPALVRRLAILGANTGKLSEVYDPKFYAEYQSLPADFAPKELKEPYDRVAPDPTKWPVLVSKIKDLGRDFKGYSVQEVKSIQASTLIMMGDRDVVRPEHAVEMFRLIPNARLAIIAGSDHFVLFTSPEKVLGTLTSFLAESVAGR
jgi:pimeloyl-ACP methyl ester carboxylesterase